MSTTIPIDADPPHLLASASTALQEAETVGVGVTQGAREGVMEDKVADEVEAQTEESLEG